MQCLEKVSHQVFSFLQHQSNLVRVVCWHAATSANVWRWQSNSQSTQTKIKQNDWWRMSLPTCIWHDKRPLGKFPNRFQNRQISLSLSFYWLFVSLGQSCHEFATCLGFTLPLLNVSWDRLQNHLRPHVGIKQEGMEGWMDGTSQCKRILTLSIIWINYAPAQQ